MAGAFSDTSERVAGSRRVLSSWFRAAFVRPQRAAEVGEGFKCDDGYTLTEMLVVIAIIGLIAAALTPALFGQMNRARAKSAELEVETVAAAVEAFRSDVGRYPSEAEGLAALIKEPQGVEGWSGPYVKGKKGVTDPWGHPLSYRAAGSSASFKVISLGADGKIGGTGLDRDIAAPAE